jgi:uncharacterized cupin superfamily protein
MYVEPGQGNAAHTHEVEEAFFVLKGFLDVFIEDGTRAASASRAGSALGSASPARPASFTDIRTTASSRSISR